MNQQHEYKDTNDLIAGAINQAQLSLIEAVISWLEKYPVQMVINALEDYKKGLKNE